MLWNANHTSLPTQTMFKTFSGEHVSDIVHLQVVRYCSLYVYIWRCIYPNLKLCNFLRESAYYICIMLDALHT